MDSSQIKATEFLKPGASVWLLSAYEGSRTHIVEPGQIYGNRARTICSISIVEPFLIGAAKALDTTLLHFVGAEAPARINAKIYCVNCACLYAAKIRKCNEAAPKEEASK